MCVYRERMPTPPWLGPLKTVSSSRARSVVASHSKYGRAHKNVKDRPGG